MFRSSRHSAGRPRCARPICRSSFSMLTGLLTSQAAPSGPLCCRVSGSCKSYGCSSENPQGRLRCLAWVCGADILRSGPGVTTTTGPPKRRRCGAQAASVAYPDCEMQGVMHSPRVRNLEKTITQGGPGATNNRTAIADDACGNPTRKCHPIRTLQGVMQ